MTELERLTLEQNQLDIEIDETQLHLDDLMDEMAEVDKALKALTDPPGGVA